MGYLPFSGRLYLAEQTSLRVLAVRSPQARERAGHLITSVLQTTPDQQQYRIRVPQESTHLFWYETRIEWNHDGREPPYCPEGYRVGNAVAKQEADAISLPDSRGRQTPRQAFDLVSELG